ncbi:hypothetical protein Y032_0455g1759 [Ancylostoma ceylanicum]|uniref:Uncharacterized protein n=1 Tax=Ancylostoma ceylanicum TaxID=53326 RepID=A0A016WZF4_9BILA|nr:hypothetical protein Y032_0455g1759 [Ancylostoma ceylanicum]
MPLNRLSRAPERRISVAGGETRTPLHLAPPTLARQSLQDPAKDTPQLGPDTKLPEKPLLSDSDTTPRYLELLVIPGFYLSVSICSFLFIFDRSINLLYFEPLYPQQDQHVTMKIRHFNSGQMQGTPWAIWARIHETITTETHGN